MWYREKEIIAISGFNRHALHLKVKKGEIKRKVEKGVVYFQLDEESVVDENPFFSKEENGYFFDEKSNEYIFFGLPNQPKVVSVSKEKIDNLVSDYSNHSGGMTVNQIAGKYALDRNTVKRILSILGKTHDSSPFTDEHLSNESEDSLIKSLIRKKEHRVLVKADKIRFKSVNTAIEELDLFKSLISDLKKRAKDLGKSKVWKSKRGKTKKTDYCYLFGLTDLHIGKRAKDYGSQIACEYAIDCINQGMKIALAEGTPSRWVITCGSDMMNADTYKNTTTQGTPQDSDLEVSEMVHYAYKTLEEIIQNLLLHAPVVLVPIQGNHDRLTTDLLGLMLEARFMEDDVEVLSELEPYKFYRFGDSLLGFNHGDKIKHSSLPMVMASQNPSDWGECKGNWDWFTGHYHGLHLKVEEFSGCRVWIMPSLSGSDKWHRVMGYTGNGQKLAMFKIDSSKGVVGVELISPTMKKK